MADLGIPDAPPPPCHDVPTFGCLSCIARDRNNYAAATYAAWKKTYKLPLCPSCGARMIHWGSNSTATKLEGLVICSRHDADGCATCEDQDLTVVIE